MSSDSVLRVRRIIVVDERGVSRVEIGAPLRDPPIFGRRIDRGGHASGILLFDAEGNERTGYATFDESGAVLLTLDEVGGMVAQFVAGRVGGPRLILRDQFRDNTATLGVAAGGPYLRLQQGAHTLVSQPDTSHEPRP